jgi:hypothetical protein
MTSSSELGAAIEAAVSTNPNFVQHREPVKYLCFFRTRTGRLFAFERVTKTQITLWLPDDERVRAAAEAQNLPISRSEPFQNPSDRSKYGRIHTLKTEPQLKDAPLYRVAVSTVGQAVAVLEALS